MRLKLSQSQTLLEKRFFQLNKAKNKSNLVYSFKRANYENIREELDSLNIPGILSEQDDTNLMLDKFYEVLYSVIDGHVPKLSLKINNNPIWFTKKLCNLKNRRNRIYKKFCFARKQNSSADDSKFHKINDEFIKIHEETHEKYKHDISESFETRPKEFWNHINGKRKSNLLPCKLNYKNRSAITEQEKADMFANTLI